MRELLPGASDGDRTRALALDVYLHRLRAGDRRDGRRASAASTRCVFTGGVGEHAPAVRAAAADGLGFLGVALDPDRNADGDGDAEIAALAPRRYGRRDRARGPRDRAPGARADRLDQRSSDG